MKKHRLLIALLVICMMTGCTGKYSLVKNHAKKNTSIRIGISVYNQYDTFVTGLVDFLNICAKKKERETGVTITVDIVNASGNQITQNEQVESFADKNYDIICVNLVDRTNTSVIIDKVKSCGIPIIFFNRELVAEDLERWNKLYYVGAHSEDSGELQGEILTKLWKDNQNPIDKNKDGKMQYVMLEGEAGHQDALVRTEYSINTITQAGITVDKLANGIANWNREQASTKMKLWMTKYGKKMEVVFANNDDMALGALDALRNAGWKKRDCPIIVGIDGTIEALEELKSGNLAGTVLNDAYGQAKAILELAYALGMDKPLPGKMEQGKYIRIPYRQVTRDNVNAILGEVKGNMGD